MLKRVRVKIEGAVQGVGFRPFVYRIAKGYGLKGSVNNTSEGVLIEAEGDEEKLKNFVSDLKEQKPPISRITNFSFSYAEPAGFTEFRIIKTANDFTKSVLVLPDIAICPDCRRELFDKNNRRYLYPFINCTNCGPRFSIIESIPYDRPNTVMKEFTMCEDCRKEYENPLDRRFHAQPIACQKCGPRVTLLDGKGNFVSEKKQAIELAADLIKKGKIVALKGLGGFQLIADAANPQAVKKLRERKQRRRKPFALMAESISEIKEYCIVSKEEERALLSPQAPIVLLRRKPNKIRAFGAVAPGNPYLGFMLPYTPLHLILLKYFKGIIIATSGNLTDEPMCVETKEALRRLKGIADFFLTHNRKIVRHVDDSIVRLLDGKIVILRRARGFAPMPIELADANGANAPAVIALGAQLKNTVSVKLKNRVFVSQHLGNLSNEVSFNAFKKIYNDIPALYDEVPTEVIKDLHPNYLSSKFAGTLEKKTHSVQHHLAHVAGCRAENNLSGTALGVAWDGTGYGLDGSIWGGEFFVLDSRRFAHVAQFKKFLLPGGERAIKEPPRSALGLLYSYFGPDFVRDFPLFADIFGKENLELLISSLIKKVNAFPTSSAGRLFDAVSFLLGLSRFNEFEGEAAMALEFCADEMTDASYSFALIGEDTILIDLKKALAELLNDLSEGVSRSIISGKFHNTLAEIILALARKIGVRQVVLSGGCFQNKTLTEKALNLLRQNGFAPFIHSQLPPNDGGISFGQIFAYKLEQVSPQYFKSNLESLTIKPEAVKEKTG